MKLETTLETLEDLPEELRENYVEGEDGKFHLGVLDGFVPKDRVEDTSGLKSALQKERENARRYAQEKKALEEKYGAVDLEDYERLRQLETKAEEDRAKKAGEWDKLKAQMSEQHQKELAKRDGEITRRQSALEKYLIDGQLTAAVASEKGNPDLLLPLLRARIQVVEDDAGNFVTRVVDDAGTPRVNGEGSFLTIAELVREMRGQEKYAGAFWSKGGSGGGTPADSGNPRDSGNQGGTPSNLRRSKMTVKDKVAYLRDHTEAQFMELPL